MAAAAQVETISFYGREIQLIRYDKMHPEYGGNKWFKLKYNIEKAVSENRKYIVSFGGAYSNHLYALAAICRDVGIASVGIVRGEEHYTKNSSLEFCSRAGMKLLHLSKRDYNRRFDESFIETIKHSYPDALIIPDGGANADSIRGAAEMCSSFPTDVKHIYTACGTYTTLCGMLTSLRPHVYIRAVAVLKSSAWAIPYVTKTLTELNYDASALIQSCQWKFDYHFGGYARTTKPLLQFKNEVNEKYGLSLDDVYGAKLFYALHDELSKGVFSADEKIAVVMCGRPTHICNI